MDVDVIVIGLGPGGEEVAGSLADAGLAVVGIEDRLVGGECPYWGCIPSKTMIRSSDLIGEGRRIPGTAGDADVRPDWATVVRRVKESTSNWDDTAAADRFTGKGGTLIRGRGRIVGPGEVAVGDQIIRARKGIVIASGTTPLIPKIDGLADTPYWTNREALEATELPKSLVVLGGGPIGAELAQVYARYGSAVTVIESEPHLLSREEPEAGELLAKVFADEGIGVRSGVRLERVRYEDGVFVLNGDLRAERLLVATGRRTDLKALGVGAVGLDEDAKVIETDEWLRAADGVWAVGDITGKGAFTHVSVYQGRIAARDILGQDGPPAEYHALSRVTFTDPEIGAVGMTEAEARDRGLDVRVHMTDIAQSARGWIHGAEGFIKMIEHDGILVGATSVGPVGGEVLSALTLAVQARVPVDTLRHMIWAFPTFHRAIEAPLL